MFIRKVVPENLDKQRIDYILKELELVESRNQALALIISGKVFVDNEKVLKPGKIVRYNKTIELKKDKNYWVSRGGIKLTSHTTKSNNSGIILVSSALAFVLSNKITFSEFLKRQSSWP